MIRSLHRTYISGRLISVLSDFLLLNRSFAVEIILSLFFHNFKQFVNNVLFWKFPWGGWTIISMAKTSFTPFIIFKSFVEIRNLNTSSLHVFALVVLKSKNEMTKVTDTLLCWWYRGVVFAFVFMLSRRSVLNPCLLFHRGSHFNL
jgi:hypothetical protein